MKVLGCGLHVPVDLKKLRDFEDNEPCMIRHFFIDVNPVELKYYPFMISLGKCSGSCNSVNDLCSIVIERAKTLFLLSVY